jgi:hypothetical protein
MFLVDTLYAVVDNHAPSALVIGKWISRIAFLALLVVNLLGFASIALGTAAAASIINSNILSHSKAAIVDAGSRVRAAFFILYFILNAELAVVAWKSFMRKKSNSSSKVSFVSSLPRKFSVNEKLIYCTRFFCILESLL